MKMVEKKLNRSCSTKNFKIKFLRDVKLKNVILNIIYVIIMICVLYNVIFFINTTISKKEYFMLYGISLLCMNNDLMEDDIRRNDLVIIKEVKESNKNDLQDGDIIAYELNGKIRINKINHFEQEEYVTKSNKNYYEDIERISINQIIGKKVVNIPLLGLVLNFLKSPIANILTLIFLIIIFYYNRYIFTKKKERIRKKKKMMRDKNNI